MKLNLEMEIDDNMLVDDLRREVLRFIRIINYKQTIIDHHFTIEKIGKKHVRERHQTKEKIKDKRMLKETDFEVGKLSSRLGRLKFKNYVTINDNVQSRIYYNVVCICMVSRRQVSIEIPGNADNDRLLKQLSEKSSSLNKMYVDFENCIVGHYVKTNDFFPMIIQTYRAESLVIL